MRHGGHHQGEASMTLDVPMRVPGMRILEPEASREVLEEEPRAVVPQCFPQECEVLPIERCRCRIGSLEEVGAVSKNSFHISREFAVDSRTRHVLLRAWSAGQGE